MTGHHCKASASLRRAAAEAAAIGVVALGFVPAAVQDLLR